MSTCPCESVSSHWRLRSPPPVTSGELFSTLAAPKSHPTEPQPPSRATKPEPLGWGLGTSRKFYRLPRAVEEGYRVSYRWVGAGVGVTGSEFFLSGHALGSNFAPSISVLLTDFHFLLQCLGLWPRALLLDLYSHCRSPEALAFMVQGEPICI